MKGYAKSVAMALLAYGWTPASGKAVSPSWCMTSWAATSVCHVHTTQPLILVPSGHRGLQHLSSAFKASVWWQVIRRWDSCGAMHTNPLFKKKKVSDSWSWLPLACVHLGRHSSVGSRSECNPPRLIYPPASYWHFGQHALKWALCWQREHKPKAASPSIK